MIIYQQQERSGDLVKYFDFGDENEKEIELKSEIDPLLKIVSSLFSLRPADCSPEVIQYLQMKVCSKDFLEIPTPPPENILAPVVNFS